MTKWEYLTAPILTHAAKQILDNFGSDGWELVQIAPGMNPENHVGYFKRPLEVHERPRGAPRRARPAVPEVAKPVAVYVPAVRSGNHVFTSGQLPMRSGELMFTGKVGDEVTRRGGRRVRAAVRAQRHRRGQVRGRRPVAVKHVVKVVVLRRLDPRLHRPARVANGVSELLGKVFGDAGVHARSAVGVSVLPLDAPVEVEILVEV